ncbi:unnamed protein product, partial [Adineta ricciae]
ATGGWANSLGGWAAPNLAHPWLRHYDPYGIFLDENDAIYIADRSNHRVMKWEQNATVGQWVAGLKVDGDGTHELPLNMPQDIVVDKNGTIYISDGGY